MTARRRKAKRKPELSPEQKAAHAAAEAEAKAKRIEGAANLAKLESVRAQRARKAAAHAILAQLRTRFPTVFAHAIPLALGIAHEARAAIEPRPPAKHVALALMHWCSQSPYLEGIAAGGPRRHLDGTEAGEVDQGHREHARLELERRQVKAMASVQPVQLVPVPAEKVDHDL